MTPTVFLCGDPAPDGTLTCPKCGHPSVYRRFGSGEPACDDCGWHASRGGWKEPKR